MLRMSKCRHSTPADRRLVVHRLAPVDAEDELLLAAVVALHGRDQVLLEPQPRRVARMQAVASKDM